MARAADFTAQQIEDGALRLADAQAEELNRDVMRAAVQAALAAAEPVLLDQPHPARPALQPEQPPLVIPEPNACRWCGVPEGRHFSRWYPIIGRHVWIAPTDGQRLARMRTRYAMRHGRCVAGHELRLREVDPPGCCHSGLPSQTGPRPCCPGSSRLTLMNVAARAHPTEETTR
jgi:hypothetical protein